VAYTTTRDVWNQLDGIDFRLIEELSFLSKEKGYCWPGREYLAAKLRVTVGTISRHVTKLKGLGLLEVFHRRRRRSDGTWDTKTNIYKVVRWAGNKVSTILRSLFTGMRRAAHRPKKEEISCGDLSKIGNKEVRSILEKWSLR